MRRTPCVELAELRSAYVDDALADADRERLLTHLVSCAACRTEVAELREVRSLLNRMRDSASESPATGELSSRLVSIAGQEANEPVWSRPFRRTRPGALPSARRAVRRRATAAALALGSLVAIFGLVGYAAAPELQLPAVGDPSDRVRAEFASALTQLPLASRSLNAVMMAPQSQLYLPPGAQPLHGPATPRLPLPAGAPLALLERAAGQSYRVSYSGTQQVTAYSAGHVISASVRIAFDAGQGSAVRVFDRSGHELVNGFLPVSTSRAQDREPLAILARDFELSGWVGSTVVGRPVSVVEASSRSTGHPTVVARWWIDNSTRLLLWQETYDPAGAVSVAAGFTELSISDKPVFLEHLAPRLAAATTTASLRLSTATQLSRSGWFCSDEIAGLPLVGVRSDEATDPGVLHLVYSNGVSALSVVEQRGRLSELPAAASWDPTTRAYVAVGTPSMASWQSGGQVFTVVTDGAPELVTRAVASLPHGALTTRTTMGQVHAGWVRIVERVVR